MFTTSMEQISRQHAGRNMGNALIAISPALLPPRASAVFPER